MKTWRPRSIKGLRGIHDRELRKVDRAIEVAQSVVRLAKDDQTLTLSACSSTLFRLASEWRINCSKSDGCAG